MPSASLPDIGPYTLERELGRGSFGAVYLARRGPGAEPCALKVFLKPEDAEGVARFQIEVGLLTKLNHVGIVGALESGVHGRLPWVAMDYVQGESLRERLQRGPLPADEARDLVLAVAEALSHAHRQGVVHRDLKPSNIMIDEHQRPRVTDFGLARDRALTQSLTRTGDVLGTPYYMPAEQIRDSKHVDGRVDVYALGVILYECLSGRRPYEGRNAHEVFRQVQDGRPPRLRDLAPDAPGALVAACQRAMASDVDNRWQSAQELVDALRGDAPIGTRGGRDLRTVALAGALLLGVGLGVLGVLAITRSAEAPEAELAKDAPAIEDRERDPSPEERRAAELARRAAELAERKAELEGLDPATVGVERLRLLDPPIDPELNDGSDALARGLLKRASERAAQHAGYDELLGLVDQAERFATGSLKAQAQLDRATYAFRRGRFEEATRLARRIVADGRVGFQARYVAAYGQLWQDHYETALPALERIWKDDPDGVVGLNAGAVFNSHTGKNKLGVELARASLALDPDYTDAYCSLAFCLSDLSHREPSRKNALLAESLRASSEAIRRTPDHPRPYMARAFGLSNSGRLPEALEAYTELIRLTEPTPFIRALRHRARYHFNAGDRRGALQDLERVLEQDSYDAEALTWRGVIHDQSGNSEAAAQDWVRAARADQRAMQRAVAGMPRELQQRVISVVRQHFR